MGDGYIHDPDAFDEDGEAVGSDPVDGGREAVDSDTDDGEGKAIGPHALDGATTRDDGDDSRADTAASTHPSTADRSFDWRGWVLVAAIAVCFLVIPAVILAYPYVGQQFGLSFYDTYLALPMIPAVVLAALAVWATTRP